MHLPPGALGAEQFLRDRQNIEAVFAQSADNGLAKSARHNQRFRCQTVQTALVPLFPLLSLQARSFFKLWETGHYV